VLLLLSIVCGILMALELTGDLDLCKPREAVLDTNLTIYKTRTRFLAGFQIMLFIVGLAFTILRGLRVLSSNAFGKSGKANLSAAAWTLTATFTSPQDLQARVGERNRSGRNFGRPSFVSGCSSIARNALTRTPSCTRQDATYADLY
jgi:hypothetical protein